MPQNWGELRIGKTEEWKPDQRQIILRYIKI